MQVSHVETANTHAVMGGGEARAFSMSQSAEFFTVLSDTLYRDKKRAVAREVICNAWDAHIMVGKTDVPVKITLTDEELVIQDFGPGIADERMDDIYITYGNSTKVQDENQTGGFGLGSKAPFAYSDHFSVTSSYKGTKTIYAISRGGKETKGVPDMRVMVAVPEKQSGLTVTLPVRSTDDCDEFRRIIGSVARQGGMKVELNGELLETIDYNDARQSGFLVLRESIGLSESQVYVLYGTVLYPVSSTEPGIIAAREKLSRIIPPDCRFILVAPPNSVGVTPSREALSYTDKTIETIKDLSDRIERQVKSRINQATNLLVAEVVQGLKDEDRFDLNRFEEAHIGPFRDLAIIRRASDPLTVAKLYARMKFFKKNNHEVVKRFGATAAKRWRNDRRRLRRAFLGGRKFGLFQPTRDCFNAELERFATKNILRAGVRSDTLKALYVVSGRRADELKSQRLAETKIWSKPNKFVVIAQSRAEATAFLRAHMKEKGYCWTGDDYVFFCASIPRNKPAIRASLTKEAEKLGFLVHEIKVAPPKKPKVVKPKDKFLSFKEFNMFEEGVGFQAMPSLEEPKYYIRLNTTITDLRDGGWFNSFQGNIYRIFAERGVPDIAVVRSDAQVRKVEAAGAKDAMLFLLNKVKRKSKSREVRVAELLRRNVLFSGHKTGYSSASYNAPDITGKCPMTFFEFVPIRVANKQKVVDMAELLGNLCDYIRYAKPSNYPFDHAFFSEIYTAALDAYSGDLLGIDEFNYRFDDIGLLQTYSLRESDTEGLIKIIRAVKKTGPMPQKGI